MPRETTPTLARVGGRSGSHIRKREGTETVVNKGFFYCGLLGARRISG
jgi:hypothetical protein